MNENGVIEYDEFISTVSDLYNRQMTEENLLSVFDMLDLNGDGVIDRNELIKCIKYGNLTMSAA